MRKAKNKLKLASSSEKSSPSLDLQHVDWDKIGKIFAPDKKLILDQLKNKRQRYPATGELLKLLGTGMIISLSFVFPALPMAMAPFVVDSRKYQGYRLNQSLNRLKKQKLIEIFEENGQTLVRITQNGKIRALRYKLDDLFIEKKKIWDKKWRIVIFDIPEKHRRIRDIFRDRLKMLGFYMLQDSVWVHPYPCINQVEFLRQIYKIDISVRYIVADKIENADDLLHHYGLK